jgi:class 3 adenylate cyclase/tetratricopeptide (TPR) repeat protein
MKCPRCQHENRAGAKFCEECATPLIRACGNCGAELSRTAKFCSECAHAVGQAVAGRFAAPEVYTPKHLAERILTSKAALEGERKQVSVLFADLKGSMELLADRDPEDARRLLDPVLERMMEAVHHYEGTVNQVMGDGIMALFGAPLTHEDHAVRACYAGLRMQEAVKRYAEAVRRSEGLLVQIRVGVNSGEVVVRSIGSDLHMDYTAVGQTTHLAARLEQIAAPATVLVSTETLRLSEGYVQVKPLGPVNLKGLSVPVEVYELTGTGPARTRLQAAGVRGLSRFVGRHSEITQLRDALDRAAGGHGQIVAVVGEPGLGKSRLFHEFIHSHRTRHWLVLEARSVSYGKATAYLPVVDLLRSYFRIQDRDEQREILEKVTGKLVTLDESLRPALTPILALLDVPIEDERWRALDPPQRKHRTLDALKRLLLRESQVQPLLVVFEDLHWVDSESQALLDTLVESLPSSRALLLVNYRPEYQHTWGSRTHYTQLRLDPLRPESAEELLAALLGSEAGLQPLGRLLIERTEGNPFFIEESVRTLVETQALVGERGAYRAGRTFTSFQVPATVQAILAARIDRLPPEDKRLLQTAAVVGKDVPFVVLEAVAEMTEPELRAGLGQLQGGEFLYEARLFPDVEYTFKHALTHEVAYGSLLHDRRRVLHARITAALELLYADRMAEHVERLAHHAHRGELWEKAQDYLVQAGQRALFRSLRGSARWFEQALDSLRRLPENRQTQQREIDIRLLLPRWPGPGGDPAPILANLREAEGLARALGDEQRLATVNAGMATTFRVMGDHERAIAHGQSALTSAERLGDDALRLFGGGELGAAYFAAGDYRGAVEVLRPLVARFGPSQSTGDLTTAIRSVVARAWLTFSLGALGESAEAMACAGDAVAIARAVDQPRSLMVSHAGLALAHVQRGSFAQALPPAERAVALGREWAVMDWLPAALAALGLAWAHTGRVEDGRRLLREALELETAIRGAPTQFRLGHAAEAEFHDRAVPPGSRSSLRPHQAAG